MRRRLHAASADVYYTPRADDADSAFCQDNILLFAATPPRARCYMAEMLLYAAMMSCYHRLRCLLLRR